MMPAAIIQFFAGMIKSYEGGTIAPKNVIDIAVAECYRILDEPIVNEPVPYTVKELLKSACESKTQIEKYLKSGVPKVNCFDIRNNKRARNIYERLLVKHPEIQIVNKNPITLLLLPVKDRTEIKVQCDRRDQCDPAFKEPLIENVSNLSVTPPEPGASSATSEREKNQSQKGDASNPRSQRSQRSHSSKKHKVRPVGESRHKYSCPLPECGYRAANPSKITDHVEAFHTSY